MTALAIATLTACGQHGTAVPNSAPLNGLSASTVIDDFRKAGLPALNPQEITSVKCPKVRCLQAISTDTVSVFKFPATGIAQKYAGSIANVYQIEDLVVVFGTSVSPDLKQEYEEVVARAAV